MWWTVGWQWRKGKGPTIIIITRTTQHGPPCAPRALQTNRRHRPPRATTPRAKCGISRTRIIICKTSDNHVATGSSCPVCRNRLKVAVAKRIISAIWHMGGLVLSVVRELRLPPRRCHPRPVRRNKITSAVRGKIRFSWEALFPIPEWVQVIKRNLQVRIITTRRSQDSTMPTLCTITNSRCWIWPQVCVINSMLAFCPRFNSTGNNIASSPDLHSAFHVSGS